MAAHQDSDAERDVAVIAKSLADMLVLLNSVSSNRPRAFSRFGRFESTRRRLLALAEHPAAPEKCRAALTRGFSEVHRRIDLIESRMFHSHSKAPSDILASVDGVTITSNDAQAAIHDLRDHVGHLERDLDGLLPDEATAASASGSAAWSADS